MIDDISRAFNQIENELIASMMRNLKRHQAEEDELGIKWNQWQVEQLVALEEYKKHARKKYNVKFKSLNKQIEEALRYAYTQGGNEEEIKILEALKKGVKINKTGNFFGTNTKNIDALVNSITNDFKKAEYSVLRRAEDIYRQTILDAQFFNLSGASTYKKSVDIATRDFLRKGIDSIEYKGGRRVSISSYAEMAIRTGTKRASLLGQGEIRKDWGVSTVIINKRGNACPLCLPFVGKVLIDDVWSGGSKSDGDYPLMSYAISQGLYHPNCKDSHTTYFPELEEINNKYNKKELEDIQEEYTNEENIKYCDRKIKEFSNKEKYSLDSDNVRIAKHRKELWEEKRMGYVEKNEKLGYNNDNKKNFRKFNEGEQVNKYFEEESRKLVTTKSLETIVAFEDYTKQWYININKALRNRNDFMKLEIPDYAKNKTFSHIENMRKYINKQELKDDIVVYRSLDKSVVENVVGKLEKSKGKIFEEKAFSSTSPLLESAKEFYEDNVSVCIEYHVPKGIGRGVYINEISEFKNVEYEYLLKDGTKASIKDVKQENGMNIIVMEVLDE